MWGQAPFLHSSSGWFTFRDDGGQFGAYSSLPANQTLFINGEKVPVPVTAANLVGFDGTRVGASVTERMNGPGWGQYFVDAEGIRKQYDDTTGKFIVVPGDATSHGGEVFPASSPLEIAGKNVALLNDTHRENINTFFSYPSDIRKTIYTTNAIESLNSMIRLAMSPFIIGPGDRLRSPLTWWQLHRMIYRLKTQLRYTFILNTWFFPRGNYYIISCNDKGLFRSQI